MELPQEVHIVVYCGPEWSSIQGVFYDKTKAEAFAAKMNAQKDSNDVFDRLSDYVVNSHKVEA